MISWKFFVKISGGGGVGGKGCKFHMSLCRSMKRWRKTIAILSASRAGMLGAGGVEEAKRLFPGRPSAFSPPTCKWKRAKETSRVSHMFKEKLKLIMKMVSASRLPIYITTNRKWKV